MSSRKSIKITINVTNGDAINNNRTNGKSNTGTYFLCSIIEKDIYYIPIESTTIFKFSKEKIVDYLYNFKRRYYYLKDTYPGKMENLDELINYFSSLPGDIATEIESRINDSRIFFRFKNNNEEIVKNFRSILYGKISNIVLEIEDDKCEIYASI